MNKGINLLPNLRKDRAHRRKTVLIVRLASILFLFIVSIFAITLFIIESQSPIASLRQQEADLLSNLAQLKTKRAKVITINDRSKNISDIINKRTDFYTISGVVISKIPKDVTSGSLEVDLKKTITMSATSPSLLAISTFLDNLVNITGEKKFFSKLTVGGISFQSKGNSYSLTVKADLL